jgi:two-component system chemotaxis response regulator CheB
VNSSDATPVVQRDLVVVGASAGGVEALRTLVSGLPPEFPAAILVVLHVASEGTSVLAQILGRSGPLPSSFAIDGERLQRGHVYVAPADHHLLVRDGIAHLSQGPRENGHRPAIDPLFRSAARAGGARCVGVVLSGLLDDGASGLQLVHNHGGATVVQHPDDAMFPSMPLAALEATSVDRVVPIAQMADVLCELVDVPLDRSAPAELPEDPPSERAINGRDRVEIEDPSQTALLVEGPPTALTCPECGGALWEHDNGGTRRYTCHVGHAYSQGSLVEEQGRALETSLWSAVRSLEERADIQRRLARRASGGRRGLYEDRAAEAADHATALREMLGRIGRLAVPSGD